MKIHDVRNSHPVLTVVFYFPFFPHLAAPSAVQVDPVRAQ